MNLNHTQHPTFAVVGHPNKGKSSIVSSLALDDSVQISDTPGTTTKKRSFPLTVDGKVIYELFDTPGFQRARRVLAWLEKHDVSADKKHEVVQMFIHEHKDDPKFNDEIELLEPIMDGAGIIYVVDASKPYGEEYEAEMEILRWTGQPSMALINHIDADDYTAEWKRALGHYFKMVRTFNPMDAGFKEHILLLESMTQLNEEWTETVKVSTDLFKTYQNEKITRSANLIRNLQLSVLSYVESKAISAQEVQNEDIALLEEKYRAYIRELEQSSHKNIAKVWNHTALKKSKETELLKDMDLFSKESESIFGLSKKELLIIGATSGALGGSGVDLLLGGSSLMMGSVIGGIVGGGATLFGFDSIAKVKVLGQNIGSKRLEMGPIQSNNFPYILLSRSLYYTIQVAIRSHASREDIPMSEMMKGDEKILDTNSQNELEKFHKKLRRGNLLDKKEMDAYRLIVEGILKRKIEH